MTWGSVLAYWSTTMSTCSVVRMLRVRGIGVVQALRGSSHCCKRPQTELTPPHPNGTSSLQLSSTVV